MYETKTHIVSLLISLLINDKEIWVSFTERLLSILLYEQIVSSSLSPVEEYPNA